MIHNAQAAAADTGGACIGTWWFRQREQGSALGETCLVRGAVVQLPGAVRLIAAGAFSKWLYPARTKPANL